MSPREVQSPPYATSSSRIPVSVDCKDLAWFRVYSVTSSGLERALFLPVAVVSRFGLHGCACVCHGGFESLVESLGPACLTFTPAGRPNRLARPCIVTLALAGVEGVGGWNRRRETLTSTRRFYLFRSCLLLGALVPAYLPSACLPAWHGGLFVTALAGTVACL